MKKFQLWLDESGDFKREKDFTKNPSLVGGVLVEEGQLSEREIKNILNKDYVHSNEIQKELFGDFATQVLNDIKNNNGELIIFENQERLQIVDGSITYLNILSEGIIQLLQLLAAQYGHVHLDILIAVRLNMERQDLNPGEIIKEEEYILRLEEKIIMGLARRTLSNNRNWSWSIKMGSARKDQRLMLADVVCNSYLTRNSRKFNDSHREVLNSLYKDKYCFTVFEKSTVSYIKRLLGEGAIGEAIFEIYASEENLNKEEFLKIILDRLSMMDDGAIRTQLLNINIRIESLIKIDNNLKKSREILWSIQEELIPLMRERKINIGIFSLDIYLYLLTVYTHEGKVGLAEKQISLCQEGIKNLANRWESIDYYFMFKIRQAVHENNIFDFHSALNNMNEMETTIDETLGLFPLAQGIGKICTEIKSDLMGKVLGTKLQSRTFMIRSDPSQLNRAREDSDKAISEFMSSSDIMRQYQYRSMIECEGKNYSSAVNYLCKSMEVDYTDEDSAIKLLNIIIEKPLIVRLYSLMHYVRIMAEAKIGGEDNISDTMFAAWNKLRLSNSDIILKPKNSHPYEIILWKMGTYMGRSGNISAAIKYYDDAIRICNNTSEELTLRGIGLGIMAEKASLLGKETGKYNKEFNSSSREFLNNYNQFMESNLPKAMEKYFENWKESINQIKNVKDNEEKSNILWDISRKITY